MARQLAGTRPQLVVRAQGGDPMLGQTQGERSKIPVAAVQKVGAAFTVEDVVETQRADMDK